MTLYFNTDIAKDVGLTAAVGEKVRTYDFSCK